MLTKKMFILLLVCFIISSCTKEDKLIITDPATINNATIDQVELRSPATHCEAVIFDATSNLDVAGTATLLRTDNKVSMSFKVDGLQPGYAYTIWWVIWNEPENCATPNQCADSDFGSVSVEVLYATGHIVGNSGKGNFSGSLNELDDSESINDLFGLPDFDGLQDARAAEVHLVLRNHGPVIPGEVNEQISSYLGGCTTFLPDFTEGQIPDEEGECADMMFAIFSPSCGL